MGVSNSVQNLQISRSPIGKSSELKQLSKNVTNNKLGNEYYQRAQQVDYQSKKRESEMMNNAMSIHDAYLRKGMNVLAK